MRLRRPWFRTLRRRVVAMTLVLIAASFVLVAVITTVALRTFLVERLDQQLAAAGTRFSQGLAHPGDEDGDDQQFQAISGQAVGTLGARVVNGTVVAAAVVGHDDTSSRVSQAARDVLGHLVPTRRVRQLNLPGLGEYRLVAARSAGGDLLVTGLPEHPVDETIARLVGIEAVVFGVALLAVGLVGAGFIRIALRPLDRIAATAKVIAELPLASGTVTLDERAPAERPDSEVGRVAAAFNHMIEQVEAALTQRQEIEDRLRHFVADASHELRTPVAVVRSHAEYALRVDGALTPEVRRSLDRISAEADRMGRLVDDLLLLARLDSGRPLARENVDLTRVLLDSVSDARIADPHHRWRLELPNEPVSVEGDDHALRQVISNLLANARTHTPAGTHVLTSLRLESDAVEVAVADDGPGVAPEIAGRIFERFVRADDERSTTSSSSGLGLSIVAAIVEAHDGQVALDTTTTGSAFRVRLPRAYLCTQDSTQEA